MCGNCEVERWPIAVFDPDDPVHPIWADGKWWYRTDITKDNGAALLTQARATRNITSEASRRFGNVRRQEIHTKEELAAVISTLEL